MRTNSCLATVVLMCVKFSL